MDEDQLHVDALPYEPRPINEANSRWDRGAAYTARLDPWRAALPGALTGAALVIGWIELFRRVCL